MKKEDLIWLAGLLEGEGSFSAGAPSSPTQHKISIEMTDLDVIERVAQLFEVVYNKPKLRNKKWKQTYRCGLRGNSAISLMKELYPYMGLRRKQKIEQILKLPQPQKLGDYCRKLTETDAEMIFKSSDPTAYLARKYKVNKCTIRSIQKRKTWKEVTKNLIPGKGI